MIARVLFAAALVAGGLVVSCGVGHGQQPRHVVPGPAAPPSTPTVRPPVPHTWGRLRHYTTTIPTAPPR